MTMLALFGSIGNTEFLLIIFIILLLFGSSKIPALMRSMGQGVGEFKKGIKAGNEPEKPEPPKVEPPAPPAPH